MGRSGPFSHLKYIRPQVSVNYSLFCRYLGFYVKRLDRRSEVNECVVRPDRYTGLMKPAVIFVHWWETPTIVFV